MTKIHFLSLFVLMTGCNYSVPKTQDTTSGNQTIQKLPTGTIPGYQTIAAGIIAPKCLGCHSNGGGNAGGVNLESYANVSGHLAAISSAVTSGSMPKYISPLTAKEKEVFLAWIDAGGPLDSPTPTVGSTSPTPSPTPAPVPTPSSTPTIPPAEVMPDPNKIDYQMVNTRVIEPRCISCHSNSGGNSAGINLETYESVFNERSGIKSVISNGSMPRPTNRPLTSIQKQIFLTWLNKGSPETVP
ncbi:MAG: hypothetical protein PHY93_13730 [Bacteriovorax sp.]|nr:hypothetical protein [Bacteriovorax sp.]